MHAQDITVVSDFICPWCWIGHRNLKEALRQAGAAALAVRYLPFELNPDLPAEGVDRKAYRSAKFGSWARSQAMDADVTRAGALAGLAFDYARVRITPNTRLAHRLMVFAQRHGSAGEAGQLHDAIFAAYFAEGRDIGKAAVLADVAASVGFDPASVVHWLDGEGGAAEVAQLEAQAAAASIRSVPTVGFGRRALAGAQPVAAFAALLDLTPARTTAA